MKQLTVLVDMDDTIVCLLNPWVEWLNRSFGTAVRPDEITQWNISKSFPTLTSSQIYSPFFCDDFWYHVLPIDGAVESLKQLIDDGHNVLIVTNSHYQTLGTKIGVVLQGYFPFIPWENVIVTKYKQLIKGDILVDDGVHNLENGDYLKVLMDAPHNRLYDAERNGMCRVSNWKEAYAIITEHANMLE